MQPLGRKRGFTLARSPVHHSTRNVPPTPTPPAREPAQPPARLACMILICGKELDSLRKAHASTGRTCKLHTETRLCQPLQHHHAAAAPAKSPPSTRHTKCKCGVNCCQSQVGFQILLSHRATRTLILRRSLEALGLKQNPGPCAWSSCGRNAPHRLGTFSFCACFADSRCIFPFSALLYSNTCNLGTATLLSSTEGRKKSCEVMSVLSECTLPPHRQNQ